MTDYLKPKFTLPVGPRADVPWPFKPKPVRPFCETCQRPQDFCECGAGGPRTLIHELHRNERARRARS